MSANPTDRGLGLSSSDYYQLPGGVPDLERGEKDGDRAGHDRAHRTHIMGAQRRSRSPAFIFASGVPGQPTAQTSLALAGQSSAGYGTASYVAAGDSAAEAVPVWGPSRNPTDLAAADPSSSAKRASCPALCPGMSSSFLGFLIPAAAGSLTVGLLYNFSKLGFFAEAFASGTFGFGALVLGSMALAAALQLAAAVKSRGYEKTEGASFLNLTHCDSWTTPNFLLNRMALGVLIAGQVMGWGVSYLTTKTPDETHWFSKHSEGSAGIYLGAMVLMLSGLLAQVLNVRNASEASLGDAPPPPTGLGRRRSNSAGSAGSGGTAVGEAMRVENPDSAAVSLRPTGLTKAEKEKKILVYYHGNIVGEYYADLIIEDAIAVELKAIETLVEENEHQLVNYLKATKIEVGLLLNFGKKPQLKRKIFDNDKKPMLR